MAITFDQFLGSAHAGTGGTVAITTGATAAAGSRIVVLWSWFDTVLRTPTCSDGTSYTNDKQINNGSDRIVIFSRVLVGSLASGSTITLSSGGGNSGGLAIACSYLGTTGVDTTGSNTTTGTSFSSGSATNSIADALFVGGAGNETATTSVGGTNTNGNLRNASADIWDSTAQQGARMLDLIATTIGSQALTGTWASSSTATTGALVIYKGTASGSTGPYPFFRAQHRGPLRVGPFVPPTQSQYGTLTAGPVANLSNLTAGLSFTGAQAKLVGKGLPGVLSFTGTLTRLTVKAFAATLTFTGALLKAVAKKLAATLSFTGALLKAVVHGMPATLLFAGSLTKQVAKPFTATLSFTGAIAFGKQFVRAFTATLSFAGAQTLRTGKAFAAALSFTGAQSRAIGKAPTAVLSFSGAQTRAVSTRLAGALTCTGQQTKAVAKLLAGVLTFNGSQATQTSRVLESDAVSTASMGLFAPTQIVLNSSDSVSTASMGLSAPTQIILSSSDSVSATTFTVFTPGGVVVVNERTKMGVGA